jgi:hypothetical protein
MIGRADIEGSKSDVAMNAWPPQASYPCGNFSVTSCKKLVKSKGSIGPDFSVCIRTENQDQASICPFALREVSVLAELALGHLCYRLTDVPPQSNSPPDTVLGGDRVEKIREIASICPIAETASTIRAPHLVSLDSRNVETLFEPPLSISPSQ